MARELIKNWVRLGKRGNVTTYMNKDTSSQLDIVKGVEGKKGNYWVQSERTSGKNNINVIMIGNFKTKMQAFRVAKAWMKRHPRG